LLASYGGHNTYTVWAECRAFSVRPGGLYSNHYHLYSNHYHLRNTGTVLLKLKDDTDCAVEM